MTIKEWFRARKAASDARRKAAEESEIAKTEARREELRSKVSSVEDDLSSLGFKFPNKYSTNQSFSSADIVTVGPNNSVYVLNVSIKGGYTLRRE